MATPGVVRNSVRTGRTKGPTILLRFVELDLTAAVVPAWRRQLRTDWELRRTAVIFYPHPRRQLDTIRPVVILPAITLPVKRPVLMLSLMGAAGLQLCRPLRSLTPVLPPR